MLITLEEAIGLGHKCHKCRSIARKSRKPKNINKNTKLYFFPKQVLNFKPINKRIKTGTDIFRNLTCKKCDRTFRRVFGLNVHISELHNEKLKLKMTTDLEEIIEIDTGDESVIELVGEYDDTTSKFEIKEINQSTENNVIEIDQDESSDLAIEKEKNDNILNKVAHTEIQKLDRVAKIDVIASNEYDTVIIEDESKDNEVIEVDLYHLERFDQLRIKRNFVEKMKNIPIKFQFKSSNNFKSTPDESIIVSNDANDKLLENSKDSLNIIIEDSSIYKHTCIDLTEES